MEKKWQLVYGTACMVLVANLQYAWTLFVLPMSESNQWSRPAIQSAFTTFILAQTWLVPFQGYLIDRFGPKWLTMIGGVLVGLGWITNGMAETLGMLHAGQLLGGTGVGIVVIMAYSNTLKWFEERRGLAVGITAAGYGAGSALTILPIASMISTFGYRGTFVVFGVLQGVAIIVIAWFLRSPQIERKEEKEGVSEGYAPREALATPVFWVMYLMFVLVCAGGLMAIAQLAPMAHDFKIANTPITLLGLTMPALTFALSIDRLTNGVSRPFFGWVSDRLGREKTMFAAFMLEAAAVFLLTRYAHDPVAFVLLSGLVFFAWGEIFSLFPSLCADIFGKRYAATIYGILYTAKGAASVLVPLGSVIAANGRWEYVLYLIIAFDIGAALMAILVVIPLRCRMRSI